MNDRPNLGLTVNGKPLDDGAGLWVPEHMFPGATARGARVSPTWHNMASSPRGFQPAKTTRTEPQPAPDRAAMLARLRSGRG